MLFRSSTCISPHHDHFRPVYFQSLEAIEFGTSPLASEGDVPKFATFLSRILPNMCRIDPLFDMNWLRGQDFEFRNFEWRQDLRKRWERVSSAVRMLVAARAEERRDYCELETRYNELNAKYNELLARLGEVRLSENIYGCIFVYSSVDFFAKAASTLIDDTHLLQLLYWTHTCSCG